MRGGERTFTVRKKNRISKSVNRTGMPDAPVDPVQQTAQRNRTRVGLSVELVERNIEKNSGILNSFPAQAGAIFILQAHQP